MADRQSYRIPPKLIVLDMLGAVLIALGLMEWISGTGPVPDQYKFPN